MTDPTTIARSLSEAQRAALLTLDRKPRPLASNEGLAVFSELRSLGLAIISLASSEASPPPRWGHLTPLGVAVRAAILAEQEGGA